MTHFIALEGQGLSELTSDRNPQKFLEASGIIPDFTWNPKLPKTHLDIGTTFLAQLPLCTITFSVGLIPVFENISTSLQQNLNLFPNLPFLGQRSPYILIEFGDKEDG